MTKKEKQDHWCSCNIMKTHILTIAKIALPRVALFVTKKHFVICKMASSYLAKPTLFVITNGCHVRNYLKEKWFKSMLNAVFWAILGTSEVFQHKVRYH